MTTKKYNHPVEIKTEFGDLSTGWSKRGSNPNDPLELGHFIDQVASLLIRVHEAAEKGASKNIINNYIQQIALSAKEQKSSNNLNRKAYEDYLKKLKK